MREGTGGGVIIVDWDRPGKLGVREGTRGGGGVIIVELVVMVTVRRCLTIITVPLILSYFVPSL